MMTRATVFRAGVLVAMRCGVCSMLAIALSALGPAADHAHAQNNGDKAPAAGSANESPGTSEPSQAAAPPPESAAPPSTTPAPTTSQSSSTPPPVDSQVGGAYRSPLLDESGTSVPTYSKQEVETQSQWSEYYDPYRRQREQKRVRHQIGLDFSVPMLVTENLDRVRPGFGFNFRYGVDFGVLVPEVGFGFSRNSVDLGGVATGFGDEPLRAFFFNLGLRAQIPNRSIALPYLAAAMDFTWWNFAETEIVCDPFYCFTRDAYRFAPALTFRAGTDVLFGRTVGFDVGVRMSVVFPGDFFEDTELVVGPYLGFKFRSL